MTEMHDWLQKNKMWWWWVPDVTKLDEEAIVEGTLNYGYWHDFLYLKEKMGLTRLNQLFTYMTKEKKRVNIRPRRRALFTHYFARYAKN